MTVNTAQVQRVLDKTYLVIPIGLAVGLGFWLVNLWRKNR